MGWGSSTRRGGGRKVRALPRKFVFLGFRREESGMSREFCRDVQDPWGCSKSLCKKRFVRIFRSLRRGVENRNFPKVRQKLKGVVFTGGSFRKGVAVPIGVPRGGVWGRVRGGDGGWFSFGKRGKRARGWGGWGVGWGPARNRQVDAQALSKLPFSNLPFTPLKSGYERVQKVFWTEGAKNLLHWCKTGLHRCKTGFRRCKRPLGDLCPLGPKHLLHPHFRELPIFDPLSQAAWFARRDDNKNEICVFFTGRGREANRPITMFFLGNAMTIKN